jgi:CheY-like chemotaxis protein
MHIWVVDDDPGNVAMTLATLALVPGVVARGFPSGGSALEALRTQPPPTVVLMDFYMGSERGDAVTRQLRARCPGVRVVGYSSARSGSEAIVAAGGCDIVRKRRSADGLNHDLLAWLSADAR